MDDIQILKGAELLAKSLPHYSKATDKSMAIKNVVLFIQQNPETLNRLGDTERRILTDDIAEALEVSQFYDSLSNIMQPKTEVA